MNNYSLNTGESDKPIGFYDSGVGGLNVLYETIRILPTEDYIYYGDNLNAPYGQKSESDIKELSLKCADFLYKKNVKSIVIACNTATTVVVKAMREIYNIPIFSMEPAIKPAKDYQNNGMILVLATNATLSQQRYKNLINQLNLEKRVINIACPELVEIIENDNSRGEFINIYLKRLMQSLKTPKNVCSVVLGCTHFAHIEEQIKMSARKYLNPDCVVFDGRFGTAKYIKKHLGELKLLSTKQKAGSVRFYSSSKNNYSKVFNRLIQK